MALAMVQSCPAPSLHGRSRLSRSSGVAAPPPPQRLFAGEDARTTPLTNGELRALTRRQCKPVTLSDDDLPPPVLLSRENLQLQAQLLCSQFQSPPLSLDNLNAPVSEDDVDILAPMFRLCAAHPASPRPAGTRSDDQKAGEKRRSPPWPSCISDDDDEEEPPPLPVKWASTKIMRWSRAAHQASTKIMRWSRAAHQASPRSAGTSSDDQQAGEKRRFPPWPSCISDDDEEEPLPLPVKWVRTKIMRWSRAAHQASPRPAGTRSDDQQAGEKRTFPPWPSCISDDDDEPPHLPVKRARTNNRIRRRVAPLPPPPPPPVMKAPAKIRSRRRVTRLRLREWHNRIARLILGHQFRAPEVSLGRTALGCQCHELALADGGSCALHQDTREPEDRTWMYSAQGRFPLVGGPGRVLVPTLAAGNSKATVVQYARWRRGVRMPTRFYVENAVAQQRGMAAAVDQQPEDDGAIIDILYGHELMSP